MNMNLKKIVNLTPHQITVVLDPLTGQSMELHSEGNLRLSEIDTSMSPIEGIPCVSVEFGLENIPEPQTDTIFIVSMAVCQTLNRTGRMDFYAPDTGASAIRYTEFDAPTPKMMGLVKAVIRLRQFK